MRELEKILEEIIEQLKADGCIIDDAAGNRTEEIIRKHMTDGWVQVEEHLPKDESRVWVVLGSTNGSGYREYSTARYLKFENYKESHWCDNHYGYLEWDKYSDGKGGCSQYKVIAWMPIVPYRPEQPETCKYTGGSCCWPIDQCGDCPNNPEKET